MKKQLNSILGIIFSPLSNPIIVKELRSRMRGPRAFLTLTGVLILMALISYAIYQFVIITSAWSYSPLSPQIGQTLFAALAVLEMMMVCMITPAITAGAISGEYEKQTYEILLTTPLNPTRILRGKLISGLSYIFLLIFAAIPIGSLVFIYGGVAPRDMFKALVVLVCTAIMVGTIGIFMSALFKRSGRATIASYLIVLIFIATPTITYAIIGIIRQAEPPRWLLVPSPINALLSAIAPSTTIGNTGISMVASLSMLMGGNLGMMISPDSIPRPLYHYTLPLYGFITLALYLFATRLIRPSRRWQLKFKEIAFGMISIVTFIAVVAISFGLSMDRYENISIFSAPTPFVPTPIDPNAQDIEENLKKMPITDEETTAAYAAVIRETFNLELLPNAKVIVIPGKTFSDPEHPEDDQIDHMIFPEDVQEGIPRLVEDLPFKIIWQDDFTKLSSSKENGVSIILGNLEPSKPDFLQVTISIHQPDNDLNQTLTFNTFFVNGLWSAQLKDPLTPQDIRLEQPNNIGDSKHLSIDEISSIYAAVVRQVYTVDTPIPGEEINTLYLVHSTNLSTDPIVLPPEVQIQITNELSKMPFSINWIDSKDDIPKDNLDLDFAIITFGNIVQNGEDGSAEVILDLFFTEIDRVLVTYILQEVKGKWQITEFGGMG